MTCEKIPRHPEVRAQRASKDDGAMDCRVKPGNDTRAGSAIDLERGDKGLLRNFDLAEFAHALFAFLLLLQQFALSRHVAAVAFRGHVLAERADCLADD